MIHLCSKLSFLLLLKSGFFPFIPFDIKPFFDWIGATESGFKLFVKEKIKYDLHKVSQSENSIVSIQSYFDTDYFSDNSTSIESFFIIYHKGI